MAKRWTRFDLAFSLGLVLAKAERLLVHERALLYWPLFRAGVLPEPALSLASRWRSAIESVVDSFWLATVAAALAGLGMALARRRWLALTLLPFMVVLAGLYTVIFADPRYRLPISVLSFPFAAGGLIWLAQTARDVIREHRVSRAVRWQVGLALGLSIMHFRCRSRAGLGRRQAARAPPLVCPGLPCGSRGPLVFLAKDRPAR